MFQQFHTLSVPASCLILNNAKAPRLSPGVPVNKYKIMSCFSKYVHKDKIIKLDYERADVPKSVRILKPTLYQEGTGTYCCILGEDPQAGIFGCGNSPEAAMESWDRSYQELLYHDPQLQQHNHSVSEVFDMYVAWKRE